MTYSTAQAAIRLNLALRTVQRWCAVLGYKREGRDYRLTDSQVRHIAERAQDGPGRPRKHASPDERSVPPTS